jgi:hypothetical protein
VTAAPMPIDFFFDNSRAGATARNMMPNPHLYCWSEFIVHESIEELRYASTL